MCHGDRKLRRSVSARNCHQHKHTICWRFALDYRRSTSFSAMRYTGDETWVDHSAPETRKYPWPGNTRVQKKKIKDINLSREEDRSKCLLGTFRRICCCGFPWLWWQCNCWALLWYFERSQLLVRLQRHNNLRHSTAPDIQDTELATDCGSGAARFVPPSLHYRSRTEWFPSRWIS